jgi:hypothetical protein
MWCSVSHAVRLLRSANFRGLALMLQKNPETQSVRDQQ